MIKLDDIERRLRRERPPRSGYEDEMLARDIALASALVDEINAELATVLATIRPDSRLDAQIAEREADRAELARLERDEQRDAGEALLALAAHRQATA